jgi:hypothetical protein
LERWIELLSECATTENVAEQAQRISKLMALIPQQAMDPSLRNLKLINWWGAFSYPALSDLPLELLHELHLEIVEARESMFNEPLLDLAEAEAALPSAIRRAASESNELVLFELLHRHRLAELKADPVSIDVWWESLHPKTQEDPIWDRALRHHRSPALRQDRTWNFRAIIDAMRRILGDLQRGRRRNVNMNRAIAVVLEDYRWLTGMRGVSNNGDKRSLGVEFVRTAFQASGGHDVTPAAVRRVAFAHAKQLRSIGQPTPD